jgi:N-acetylglucosamine kinase-like BadF-type ATPase
VTYVIGVDGGGTRTRAVLVDLEGQEIGRGEAPGAVATAHEPEAASAAVLAAIDSAVETSEVSLPAAVLWAGLAGAGSDTARRAVTDALTLAGPAREIAV